jgi:hypothetical protein
MCAAAWARLPLVPLLSVQPDTTTTARADITQIRRATRSAVAAHSKTGECSPVRAIALLALPNSASLGRAIAYREPVALYLHGLTIQLFATGPGAGRFASEALSPAGLVPSGAPAVQVRGQNITGR